MTCVVLTLASNLTLIEDLIRCSTAARLLGCREDQVTRYLKQRRLTCFEIDSVKFINRREVLALKAELANLRDCNARQLPNRKQPDQPYENRAPRVPLPVEPSE